MKLIHIHFKEQYSDHLEEILDRCGVELYVAYPGVEGRDRDGKHQGSQAFPDRLETIQAQVPEEKVDQLLDALRKFRDEKKAHQHLEAVVLPIERRL